MKRLSLTTRLALLYALIVFTSMALVGTLLYRDLERELSVRDDGALVTRVDQLRTLMKDVDVRKLIHDKPRLFGNMLGNTESLLIVRFPGEAPLITVNPGNRVVPNMTPVPADAPLTLDTVRHTRMADGTAFIYVVAAAHDITGPHDLQIISGRLMLGRTQLLQQYRSQILLWSSTVAVAVALLAFALARRSLRPLRLLAAKTGAIGISTLSTRIEQRATPPELDALIAAFNGMLDRLERGFTQLKQVSADMAHDLRTPIGNLLGQTEVGLSQTRDVAYYQRLLGSNYEELQRMSKMIDNMLFLARTEQADNAIERKDVLLADEFELLQEYFEGIADERNVRLEWRGEGCVSADPLLLRRALGNLLANALRYAEPGTAISTVAEQEPDRTTLHVENRGPTIEPHHLERIFDRFYRADASRHRSSESSGLGLSIVRSIMSLHGGTCHASSENGVTRFTLVFPQPEPTGAGIRSTVSRS
ncbi:two-component sensor histidine kinase [Paraburkholderia ginsengiterrae]|uniref:Sensor protein n=1 Tax=Paraburkholderia ginsengiterrae TaxID=1462993 RepID=A0A1A9NGX9_9BURK|nr:heavy metal sensor histidine kinase [Paraburkholderia ginsengiterrae]OAJ62140.1 two-component sensor histidine kinase [Paraburkholderia ginsengiterrae]OAJ65499.1 two-component sensor histidine kinase [Paraburkholderia ginsengiterrae]